MKFIFLLSFFFSVNSWAEKPLIQAPGVSPQEYQRFLNTHSSFVSVSSFLSQNRNSEEEKVFALADHLEKTPTELLTLISDVRTKTVFTDTTAAFLRDLMNRLETRSFSSGPMKTWKELVCFNDSLLGQMNKSCLQLQVSTRDLRSRFPWADMMKIENHAVDLNGNEPWNVHALSMYHFQILSNTHQSVSFYGTYAQLLQQVFAPEPWVQGTCDGFTTGINDFSMQEQGFTFFGPACILPLRNPPQKSSFTRWMNDNKPWLYAAGALIVGGIAYSMKDKTVVINTGLK